MRPDHHDFQSDGKLEELVLFIAARSEGDLNFGSTKLNKLLFFADFAAYAKLGQSITGAMYQKLKNGPAPRRIVPVIKKLVQRRDLAIQERDRFGKTQKVPIALREARLDDFSAKEIAIVADTIAAYARNNARGISSKSHEFAGWKLAEIGEDIPYEVSLVEFQKIKKDDIAKAMSMRVELAALRDKARNRAH
jgi:uncharacterized phage-associated protein